LNQERASIISNREIMPGTYLVWLESPRIATEAGPGQFVMVRCGEGTLLRRPFSIHQVDGNNKSELAFLFRVVGKGTSWLSQCKAGDRLDLLGPLGNGYTIHPASRKLLLVAGGIGIAPLRFLAQEALNKGYSVKLLLGAETAAQLYPDHLLPLEARPVTTTTEDGTAGKRGMVTDLLPDFAPGADQVFACGPAAMYHSMANNCPQLKGRPVQVSLEVRMGCGLGACYGCSVRTRTGLKQVCKDGPVFALDDFLGDKLDLVRGHLS